MKRILFFHLVCWFTLSVWAAETIHIANPQKWTNASLSSYVGKVVKFDVPMFLPSTYSNSLSPKCLATAGTSNTVTLTSAPSHTRAHVFSRDLQAKVVQSGGNYQLQYISGSFSGNTRATLSKGLDSLQIDKFGKHTLLVCATNLEYYLVKNLGTGYGPRNQQEHDAQRTKTRQALALINADIYGFCEIEQGTEALQEICTDMNGVHPDRKYTYVYNATSSSAGSYTMTAFVYDANTVHPMGKLADTQIGVKNRKYMQYFVENATDEGFIFSINHFKAKSGGGDTEATRVSEANAVNSLYYTYKSYCHEEDILIMGDLNAYPTEEPIQILLQNGTRTDLHAYCHPEGSYSYLYAGVADYLDHAIVNATMLNQVTGMQAYHVNSDERDCLTYDGSCNDGSMYRYSDHDPIVVGLCLTGVPSTSLQIVNIGENFCVKNGEGGYVRMYDMSGNLLFQHTIDKDNYTIFSDLDVPHIGRGCYVVHVYYDGENKVTKFLRP